MWEPRMLRVMVALALALALGIAGPAAAQERLKIGDLDIGNFCAAVSNPLAEMSPKHPSIRYQYQNLLADAARVLPTDTDDQIYAKIGVFINANAGKMRCSQPDFNPNNGNIFKLAVSRQSNRFIDDILARWKVDLNLIDEVDGKTVLDFIVEKRTEYSPGSPFERTLDRYYNRFRAAGAKHRSELGR